MAILDVYWTAVEKCPLYPRSIELRYLVDLKRCTHVLCGQFIFLLSSENWHFLACAVFMTRVCMCMNKFKIDSLSCCCCCCCCCCSKECLSVCLRLTLIMAWFGSFSNSWSFEQEFLVLHKSLLKRSNLKSLRWCWDFSDRSNGGLYGSDRQLSCSQHPMRILNPLLLYLVL